MKGVPDINTQNQSAVKTWVREQQRKGNFRKCAHLHVEQFTPAFGDFPGSTPSIYDATTYFLPKCERRSFTTGLPVLPDDYEQRRLMVFRLADELFSCPRHCVCYENKRWNRIRTWCKTHLAPLSWLSAFAKLSGLTQAIIAITVCLLVLWLIAPSLIPLLVELIKAFK